LTQRYVWWVAVFACIVVLPNVLVLVGPKHGTVDRARPIVFTIAMPMFFLIPVLVGQAKMQFAHSRARLLPNFLPAHLTLLSALLLILFIVIPIAIALLGGFEPIGVLALTAAVGATALWGSHLNRFGPMLISLAA